MQTRAFSFAVLFLVSSGVVAQEKRAMTIVDLIEVPQLRDPQLSPDGRQLAYVLERADWEANEYIRHVWRVDADGGDAVQLTYGDAGAQSPRWSPDGSMACVHCLRAMTTTKTTTAPGCRSTS